MDTTLSDLLFPKEVSHTDVDTGIKMLDVYVDTQAAKPVGIEEFETWLVVSVGIDQKKHEVRLRKLSEVFVPILNNQDSNASIRTQLDYHGALHLAAFIGKAWRKKFGNKLS